MPIDNEIYNQTRDIWWDEDEPLHLLRTAINPARFEYMRRVLVEKLNIDLQGKKTLDVGCGGGILAEEFARLGCAVTGIDPSEPSLATARKHASQSGLQIDYQTGTGESIPFADESFHIVYCCDVLEHVPDLERVIAEIARVLKKDGVFFYDTINRTFPSKLVMIKIYQEWNLTSIMPPNMHDWNMFIKPDELRTVMKQQGFELKDVQGMAPGAHPLVLINQFRKVKQGKQSLNGLSNYLRLQETKDPSIFYAGYAIHSEK